MRHIFGNRQARSVVIAFSLALPQPCTNFRRCHT